MTGKRSRSTACACSTTASTWPRRSRRCCSSDLGADVVKVEPPRGDEWRRYDPFEEGESRYFYALNRGKRSVALDLKTAGGARAQPRADRIGRRARAQLPARAGAASFGLDRESVRAVNPRCVTVCVSAFGSAGPDSDRPAVRPDRAGALRPAARGPAPRRHRAPPDRRARARRLHRRAARGAGGDRGAARPRRARAPSWRCRCSARRSRCRRSASWRSRRSTATPRRARPAGRRSPAAPSWRRSRPRAEALEALDPYYRAHACADGFVALACLNAGAAAAGLRAARARGPVRRQPAGRARGRRRARAARRRTSARWRTGFARLGGARGRGRARRPARARPSEVRSLGQLFDDEQVRANGLVQTVEQPGVGPVRLLGSPFKVDGAAAAARPAGAARSTSTPASCSERRSRR